jgi:hypothetical protein
LTDGERIVLQRAMEIVSGMVGGAQQGQGLSSGGPGETPSPSAASYALSPSGSGGPGPGSNSGAAEPAATPRSRRPGSKYAV